MPSLSTLQDNFNDGVIGANWGDSYGGVSEVGGRARVPLVAGAYAGYQTGRAWTFAGASVYLKLVTVPAASTGTDVSCNFLVTSSTDGTSIGFKYNALTNVLRMQSNTAYFDGAAVEITRDPVAHLWLRLREDGTNVYWETAPNGSTWTIRRTLATPAWITAAVDTTALDLYAFRDAGTTDFAEYDNVNTLSDGVVHTGTGAGTAESTATGTGIRTATGGGTGSANTTAAATGYATYYGTASGSAETEAFAESAQPDTSDVDFIVGRPRSGWAVSGPWR
jgi:hypothetical protein